MEQLSNVIAERAVLSGIYNHGSEAYLDVCDILGVDSFTIESNQIIFKCLKHILDKNEQQKIDTPSVYAAARELNLDHILLKKDEIAHFQAIINLQVSFENIRKLAGKIRKLEIARLIREQLGVAQSRINEVTGEESSLEILSIAENTVLDFSSLFNDKQELPKQIGDGLDDYLKNIEENPVDRMGLSSGFKIWDAAIGGGLRKGTVNVISSRMKIGKSTFGINVGHHVAANLKLPVLFLDTEMLFSDHIHKILGLNAKVKINDIETGKYVKNKMDLTRIRQATEKVKNLPYFHKNISGKEFEEVLSIMRRFVTRDVGLNIDGTAKDCLIIYDYIKLMDASGINDGLKEFQLLGFMLTSLHNFSVRYNLPILTFAQQNRDGLNKDDSGTIAGSDRILMYCSNCSLFKQKSDEEIQSDGIENGNRKLIPLICRHGPGLDYGDYINLKLEGQFGKVTEIGTKLDQVNNPHSNDDQKSFKIKNGDDHSQPSNPEYNSLRESFSKQDDSELKEIIA